MTEDLLKFVQQIARMTADGEEVEGREFIMESDDAVSTLNGLIDEARALVAPKPEAAELAAYDRYFDDAEKANKQPLCFSEWQKAGRP